MVKPAFTKETVYSQLVTGIRWVNKKTGDIYYISGKSFGQEIDADGENILTKENKTLNFKEILNLQPLNIQEYQRELEKEVGLFSVFQELREINNIENKSDIISKGIEQLIDSSKEKYFFED